MSQEFEAWGRRDGTGDGPPANPLFFPTQAAFAAYLRGFQAERAGRPDRPKVTWCNPAFSD